MTAVKVIVRKTKGGPGSGNWGHSGRPGAVGGSAPGGASTPKSSGNFPIDKNGRITAAPDGWKLQNGDAVKTLDTKDGSVNVTVTAEVSRLGTKSYRAFVSGQGEAYAKFNVPRVRRDGIYLSTLASNVQPLIDAIEQGGLKGYRKYLRENIGTSR